jgi:hypothetical protein
MERAARYAPWVVATLAVGYILGAMRPAPAARNPSSSNPRDQMHLAAFARLPVLDEGRYKPLDTWVRQHLAGLSMRQEYKDPDHNTEPAIRWLLNLTAYGIIGHLREMDVAPEVAKWFGADAKNQMNDVDDVIDAASKKKLQLDVIKGKPEDKRSPLEQAVLKAASDAESRRARAAAMEKSLGSRDNPEMQEVFRIDFDQILQMLKLEPARVSASR